MRARLPFAGAAALALCVVGGAWAQARSPEPGMARELVAAASAFETFMGKAGAIDARFANPNDVADAVKVGAAHDAQQLQSGMIAYAALAALNEPAFVAGVERAARYDGPEALARQLMEQPDFAAALPGAEPAAARAAAALAAKSTPLTADGVRVKQAAYDVQKQPWSKVKAPQRAARLASAKQLSNVRFTPTPTDAARLYRAVSTPQGEAPRGPMTPVVARGLALAALSLLDAAGEDNQRGLERVLNDQNSAACLKMAKLNLFQCLAVAGPHYEDVYCLGEHAMIEPGQCVSRAAGLPNNPPARYTSR